MTIKKIRIATRKSPLALWQAGFIANQLKIIWPNLQTELIPLQTSGDTFIKDKLLSIGGKGLFIKELEMALLSKQADIAVHSMKDLPTSLMDDFFLAAICKRDNPYDALISNKYSSLDQFPDDSVIGTSSLRRQAQILAKYPRLKIENLRGNINTRIGKLDNNEYDGIILAASGLMRLGFNNRIKQIIAPEIMLPSVGQGALGIECRRDDFEIIDLITPLNDTDTAKCVTTERYINLKLNGSCHAPIAIFCQKNPDNSIKIEARILSADGKKSITTDMIGDITNINAIADKCINDLMTNGALKLLEIKQT